MAAFSTDQLSLRTHPAGRSLTGSRAGNSAEQPNGGAGELDVAISLGNR